jgi:hypothetical protein
VTTQAQSDTIIDKGDPGCRLLTGQSGAATCTGGAAGLSSGLSADTLAHLARDLLATKYNIAYLSGFGSQTLGSLGCRSIDITNIGGGVSSSTTVAQLAARGDTLIGGSASLGSTTSAQATAFIDMASGGTGVGCINTD